MWTHVPAFTGLTAVLSTLPKPRLGISGACGQPRLTLLANRPGRIEPAKNLSCVVGVVIVGVYADTLLDLVTQEFRLT